VKKILTEWKKFLTEASVGHRNVQHDDEKTKIIDKAMGLIPMLLKRGQPLWPEVLYQTAAKIRKAGDGSNPWKDVEYLYGRAVVDSAVARFRDDYLFAQWWDKQSLFNWYDEHSGKWYDGGGGSSPMKYDVHRAAEKSQAWQDWVKSQQPWKQFLTDSLDGTMEAKLKEQGVPGDIIGKLFSSPQNFLDLARLVNDLVGYDLGDI
jgi:hypothetical protein